MNSLPTISLKTIASVFLYAALIATVITIFVPFNPGMPDASLDPSWKIGMNQAVAQGLSFGREMIFTFGPYSFIFTEAYHPATDTLMLFSCCYLAALYCACLIFLMRNRHSLWMIVYCVFLACMLYPRDALLFSVPLVIALTSQSIAKIKWQPLYIALLFSPLGLLPLAKGSLSILCITVALLCALFFALEKKKLLAAVCLIAPIGSAFFFWILIGQTPAALPDYISSMLAIISGYTEAMALDGNFFEILIYLLTSFMLLVFIASRTNLTPHKKIFIFILYGIFLFISYKAGFTRHDIHALTSGNTIGIAVLLLPFMLKDRSIIFLMILTGVTFFGITKSNVQRPERALVTQFKTTYLSAWHGIINRIAIPGWPREEYEYHLAALKKAANFPALRGATDIYSFDQSYLIASNLQWSPRPILQSYSAYTPKLAEINRQHLIGATAPENIIFKLEPIDARLPALMDGPSWPVLMKNYHTTVFNQDYLFLEKNAGINSVEDRIPLSNSTQRLGVAVRLPDSYQPIFAQLKIKPNLAGRLANILYKPSMLLITLESYHGQTRQYRFVASMARSVFLISPLIENTYEFKLLNEHTELLEMKRVKSITITASEDSPALWENDYTISFSQFKNGKP